MSSPSLKLYREIAFHDGLETLMSNFLNNSMLLNDGFEYLKEYDYYFKDEMIVNDAYNPSFAITKFNRADFLKRTLDTERASLYQNILASKDYLKPFYNELLIIITKIETIEDNQFIDMVLVELKRVVTDLQIKYSEIIQSHILYNKIKSLNPSLSYFQCKELPHSFFEKLYELTYDLNLIDDVMVTEEIFINVFTSPNPKMKIGFIKSNLIVAVYLKEIEIFFWGLRAVTIEKSQCFLNKQEKPFKSTDLYAALSRGNGKNIVEINRIKSMVNDLKNRYLT